MMIMMMVMIVMLMVMVIWCQVTTGALATITKPPPYHKPSLGHDSDDDLMVNKVILMMAIVLANEQCTLANLYPLD